MIARSKTDLTSVILFGVETEYAVHVFDGKGRPYPPQDVENMVRNELSQRLHCQSLPFLESHGGHAILNGGRAYWDRLFNISSAEYSTPEVRCPLQACAYVQAGHRFYRALADDLETNKQVSSVEVHLSGVCLATGRANGIHLNYFRSVDQPLTVLMPHLVSLPCITGSGGWAVRPAPTLQFVRSPRAELISRLLGDDSSRNRPLIDTYIKPYGFGGRRQELAGDATHSMLQLYVRLGSTALLLAMADQWGLCLNDLAPADAIAAMKVWNRNPHEPLALKGGKRCSALDVQRRLVDKVRRQLDKPAGGVPVWANDVVAAWEKLIHAASNEDNADKTALDWAVHEGILRHLCAQHQVAWEKLPAMAKAYVQLGDMQRTTEPEMRADKLRRKPAGRQQLNVIRPELKQASISWRAFEQAIGQLQPLLHLASTAFLEYGRGMSTSFATEMRRGLPALTESMINRAATHPPTDTRAAVRAAFVKKHAAMRGGAAGWEVLVRPDGKKINLDDPFDFGEK